MVSLPPDGTLIATAGADGAVRLWQAAQDTRSQHSKGMPELSYSFSSHQTGGTLSLAVLTAP